MLLLVFVVVVDFCCFFGCSFGGFCVFSCSPVFLSVCCWNLFF